MKLKPQSLLVSLLLTITATSHASPWPNGEKAAISLAYDDALPTQLDIAIPQLDKYNFKGSFYLSISSLSVTERMNEWREAAKSGHELGNHTINHSCSKKLLGDPEWIKDWNNLDARPIEELSHEISIANSFLHAIDGKTERTYTAPCIQWEAADGNYHSAIKSKFVAIKAVISREPQGFEELDPHLTHIYAAENVTGQQLINFVKKAVGKEGLASITFHGIGGDHITVSAEAHETLLAYLNDNRDIYWVDSFINIMKHVKKQKKQNNLDPK